MGLDDYKVVIYRNQPNGWVAEVPSIPGCYALMPSRAEALLELEHVFAMIESEFRDRGEPLPVDTTEIVRA
jgi:predicted RNase H-like HicB family nuclease